VQERRDGLGPQGEDLGLLRVGLPDGLGEDLQETREFFGRRDPGGVKDAGHQGHHLPMRGDEGVIHRYLPARASGTRAATAAEGLRPLRFFVRFSEESRHGHPERLGQAVEQIDGSVALFPLKFAYPGSIDASVDRQPLL